MGPYFKSLTKRILVLFVAVCSFLLASGCDSEYERVMSDYCVTKFTLDMDALERSLWCSWSDTLPLYRELTNCTFFVALQMHCFWPNQQIDTLFISLHQDYFYDCALTGRMLHDPPMFILGPFIAVPVMVTLLMTALVVWRSQRRGGIL